VPKSLLKPGGFHLQQIQPVSLSRLEIKLGALTSDKFPALGKQLAALNCATTEPDCLRSCGGTRVACEMKCPLHPTRLPLQVRIARESVCRVTLDSIAGLMQSRHRQERDNVKAFTFGVENDDVSGFGGKRDKIPVRHPIFIPVRHLQHEWAITFDCFFYLSACHNK
jgi:hypothetical protein